ncbi:tetratricopeptide repeat protein [Pseudoalteromonas sp. NEC-BIFX-2020_015]|uniref:retroviral-like aspartic protease family protein n=1 Tax=Pseudoalteromonas sp. NEC-BIFX-2020_015 TaxID=2729544 RepID=UPI0014616E76|nr:retroviral-like aspartic protease family protein [Pseudoalteromonas sp. NEC-BIFX-2020_015]NMR24546.1 tetratricopeptide repeat protein [Pseudoalteromonas sp. NEC-BIFX-2020_015]
MQSTLYVKVITLLLLASVALNGYFLWSKEQVQLASKPTLITHENTLINDKSKTNPVYEQATADFQQQRFSQAVTSYQQLKNTHPLHAERLYFHWLDTLDNWLKNNELTVADTFLQAFLNKYPYDIKMLRLNAEHLVKNQQIHQAIVAFFSLNSFANESEQAVILQRLQQLTFAQINTLSKQHAWQKIVSQTSVWLDYDNDNPHYLLALANAYYQLDDITSSQSTLERFAVEHPLQKQVDELQMQITHAQSGVDLISLKSYGAHYLLNMQINSSFNTELMIDTGASYTVIPNTVFQALRPIPDYIDSIRVNTANGQAIAQRYQVDSILIGKQYIENFEVLVIDSHSDYGLLGMNFLQLFKFNINQQTNQLELAK